MTTPRVPDEVLVEIEAGDAVSDCAGCHQHSAPHGECPPTDAWRKAKEAAR